MKIKLKKKNREIKKGVENDMVKYSSFPEPE
jgi:hypothetical protein